jgi:1-deoxy-D-xylulose-5-phosphate reductoisomerase
MQIGGTAPAVLNAADEVAVAAFLERRIRFSDIPDLIECVIDAHNTKDADSIESVKESDRWARELAGRWITNKGV